jgi:hypothetical protein
MKEIAIYNIRTLEDEAVGGVNPDMPIIFKTDIGQYHVTINRDGGIDILTLGRGLRSDQIEICPSSSNKISVSVKQPT